MALFGYQSLTLMDHESTVHPQRTCIVAFSQGDPVWQQSHYGYRRKQVEQANSF
jgi:hypothetical protein